MTSRRPADAHALRGRSLACVTLFALGCADLIGADFDRAHPLDTGIGGGNALHGGGTASAGADGGAVAQGGGERAGAPQGGMSFPVSQGGADPLHSLGGTPGVAGSTLMDEGGAGGAGGAADGSRGSGLVADGVETLDFEAIDLAAVSRGDGLLDVFTIVDGRVAFHRYDDGWEAPRYLSQPIDSQPTFAFTNVAADFANDRLHVFAVGNDGNVYYFYASVSSDEPTWIGPALFDGIGSVRVNAGLGAASMSPTRFDMVAITQPGKLGHVWGDGLSNDSEGWNTVAPWLVPLSPVAWENGLEVVSPWGGRLDILFLSLSGRSFQHHWYDESDHSWGPRSMPHREEVVLDDTTLAGGGIDALAAAVTDQGIAVFLRVASTTPRLYSLLYREETRDASIPQAAQALPASLGACPEHLFTALRWNGSSVDLFGAEADHRVWHARLH